MGPQFGGFSVVTIRQARPIPGRSVDLESRLTMRIAGVVPWLVASLPKFLSPRAPLGSLPHQVNMS